MQKSTTIIGILEMLDDSYSYRDIMARFIVGSSTITDIHILNLNIFFIGG